MAQLVSCSRFHQAEIKVSGGLCSLLEALGKDSSKFIQTVDRIQFHEAVGQVPFPCWLSIPLSASRGSLCILQPIFYVL